MTKYFSIIKVFSRFFKVFLFLVGTTVLGQEPRVFTVSDFDLVGNVKRCLVITDYGKEAFDFNKQGILTKVTTLYSDSDYDISYYKFSGGLPIEKRLENYREDSLEKQTSIAHFYEIDTLLNKIVKERVYSYRKEFLDQFEYKYDSIGNLTGIIRTTNQGIDDTQIVFDTLKGEITKTINVNGITERSLRTTEKTENGEVLRIELEKIYLKGEPYKATESFKDSLGRKVRETEFDYDLSKSSFVVSSETSYQYGEHGFLIKKITNRGSGQSQQEFIYQFDGNDPSNWIKQIITPDNEYITRRITYYEEKVKAAEKEER